MKHLHGAYKPTDQSRADGALYGELYPAALSHPGRDVRRERGRDIRPSLDNDKDRPPK